MAVATSRLRALARDPRVLVVAGIAAVGVLYLSRQKRTGDELEGTPLPVTPEGLMPGDFDLGPAAGALGATPGLFEPLVVGSGECVYNPATGAIVCAPGASTGAPAPEQDPGDSGGSQPAPAPGNRNALLAGTVAAVARRAVRKPKAQQSLTPKAAAKIARRSLPAKPSEARALLRRAVGRPPLGHPPSISNVTRAARTISGAKVTTKPAPKKARHKLSQAVRKATPKIPSRVTAAATRLDRAPKPGPVRASRPKPKPRVQKPKVKTGPVARKVLPKPPGPQHAPRRATVKAIKKTKRRRRR